MSWYVVNTRPGQEARAEINLQRLGFSPFFPKIRQGRSTTARRSRPLRPMFPNYLFLPLDLAEPGWGVVNNAFGVKRLLTDGRRPLPLPRDFVASLKATLDGSGVCAPVMDEIRPGDAVKIISGPFTDQIAQVFELAPGDRVKLMLSLFGGDVSTVVSRRDLARIDVNVSSTQNCAGHARATHTQS